MGEFKFSNSEIQNLIYKHYRMDEDIYLFEQKVNKFLLLLNEFPEEFSFKEKGDIEFLEIPVEDTYKIIESFKDIVSLRIKLLLTITAYKLNNYFKLVLNGLNKNEYFSYFPTIRAIIEHTCFSYKILNEAKIHSNFMDSFNNQDLDQNSLNEYIKSYGKFEDIIRFFIFGTKNHSLINYSIKNNKIEEFSVRKCIDFVMEKTDHKQLLDSYKYFSELTHPSSFNTNYFLCPDKINMELFDNLLINKSEENNIYSLNSKNKEMRLGMYFKEIIYTLTDCMELFEELDLVFKNYEIGLPNLDILKNVKFEKNNDIKMKEFLESEEYLNNLRKTVKKNKFKSNENIHKETEKIIKRKEHEVRRNKN